jgi:hypothetical protein
MARRRPRCVCGDLYSEHDLREQSDTVTYPCRGAFCAEGMQEKVDSCDAYQSDGDVYVSAAEQRQRMGLAAR